MFIGRANSVKKKGKLPGAVGGCPVLENEQGSLALLGFPITMSINMLTFGPKPGAIDKG